MFCHHGLQHLLLSLVPVLRIEKFVAKSPHVAEVAVPDLKEELPFDNVARFAIGKSTRARLNGRFLDGAILDGEGVRAPRLSIMLKTASQMSISGDLETIWRTRAQK